MLAVEVQGDAFCLVGACAWLTYTERAIVAMAARMVVNFMVKDVGVVFGTVKCVGCKSGGSDY